MISFAETPWHTLTAIVAFLAGLAVAFTQKRIFQVPTVFALALYAWHTAMCIVYFVYSLNNIADSTSYYINSIYRPLDFKAGTEMVTVIVHQFSVVLNMSYGGTFLVFNIVGFIGMVSLASALRSVCKDKRNYTALIITGILFLPGLSYWSSAIGKDALTFMASSLACWAALNLGRRYPAMIIAVIVTAAARPHIAGILIASFAVSSVIFMRLSMMARVSMMLMLAPLAIFAVRYGLEFAGVGDVSSAEAITNFVETRQGHNLGGGSSVSISDMSVPMRLFTYLFRPLIFDAHGLLGIIVSLENIILFTLLALTGFHALTRSSSLSHFQIAFFSIFTLVALMVLANTTANLGIAIRQKWMVLPMILVLALAVIGQPRRVARLTVPLSMKRLGRSMRTSDPDPWLR